MSKVDFSEIPWGGRNMKARGGTPRRGPRSGSGCWSRRRAATLSGCFSTRTSGSRATTSSARSTTLGEGAPAARPPLTAARHAGADAGAGQGLPLSPAAGGVAGRDLGPDGPRARDIRPRNRRRGPRPGRGFGFGARELRRCGAAHQTYRSLCAGLGLGDENGTAGAERPSLVHNPIIGAAPRAHARGVPGGRGARLSAGARGVGCGDFANCRSCKERYNSTGGLRLPPRGERPRTANETLTRFLEMVRGITREVRPRAPARPGGGRRLTGRGRWRRSKRRETWPTPLVLIGHAASLGRWRRSKRRGTSRRSRRR